MKSTVVAMVPCADASPFEFGNEEAYQRWRATKLAHYPTNPEGLIVEVAKPDALSAGERDALLRVCRKTNMAIYRVAAGCTQDKAAVRALAAQCGLVRLAHNPLADDDSVTTLRLTPEKAARGYIPYSNKRLLWHTDGYYNVPAQSIGAFVLHCAVPATDGGVNALLDPEMVYLQLRDQDRDWVRALMAPDAMTIPANTESGSETRPACTGPVFRVDPGTGGLQMRYTARTRSIVWSGDGATPAAVEALERLVADDAPYVFRRRLSAGEGIICNNVLHSRTAFTDAAEGGRVMYRARYYDRIADTGPRTGPTSRIAR